jgi:hypothetical protein
MSMFTFGATLASLFAKFAKSRGGSAPQPSPPPAPSPGALFALVQTKPHVVVLAISSSQDELLKEVTELNASWNHWDLRTESHRYEVQRVPILVRVPPATAPAVRSIAASRNK